jgi:hypothetical protein
MEIAKFQTSLRKRIAHAGANHQGLGGILAIEVLKVP